MHRRPRSSSKTPFRCSSTRFRPASSRTALLTRRRALARTLTGGTGPSCARARRPQRPRRDGDQEGRPADYLRPPGPVKPALVHRGGRTRKRLRGAHARGRHTRARARRRGVGFPPGRARCKTRGAARSCASWSCPTTSPPTRRSGPTASSASVRPWPRASVPHARTLVSDQRRAGTTTARARTPADVVFVYTLGSLLRVSVSNAASKIMFNDLPSVDAILDMCHVRARAGPADLGAVRWRVTVERDASPREGHGSGCLHCARVWRAHHGGRAFPRAGGALPRSGGAHRDLQGQERVAAAVGPVNACLRQSAVQKRATTRGRRRGATLPSGRGRAFRGDKREGATGTRHAGLTGSTRIYRQLRHTDAHLPL